MIAGRSFLGHDWNWFGFFNSCFLGRDAEGSGEGRLDDRHRCRLRYWQRYRYRRRDRTIRMTGIAHCVSVFGRVASIASEGRSRDFGKSTSLTQDGVDEKL
jgi:hypothetical protein